MSTPDQRSAAAEAVHPDLAGQVAVVTGGARGLGFSMASALARQGVDVALLDVLDDVTASAERLAQETGVRASGHRCDVTDDASVAAAFAAATQALGRPSVLVTAAGVAMWADSEQVGAAQWRRVVDINLTGTFLCAQAFARPLLAEGAPGTVITVGSMSAHIVNVPQHQASYNASKAGVVHLTASLAVEWASRGIRVNAISPGYMLSDMTRTLTESEPQLKESWIAATPAGRMGEPADLDGLVCFLASRSSRFITGQSIIIDGGYTLP
jgi:NAD(P)-dependent dehydrogenase (short-subunit alcohol dehydrogenase family)